MSDPWADPAPQPPSLTRRRTVLPTSNNASDQTLRAAVRRAITDAYYDARNAGRTMEMAADDATEAVILVVEHGWTDSALASSQPTTPPCCDDKGGSFCRDTTGLSSSAPVPLTLPLPGGPDLRPPGSGPPPRSFADLMRQAGAGALLDAWGVS